MYEQFLGRIQQGMDVCDLNKNKIGTVGRIFRPVGARQQAGLGQPTSSFEPYLKVDTGVLGLGKDLYVPASHIQDVTDCVLLNIDRDRLDQLGWDQRPSFIQD